MTVKHANTEYWDSVFTLLSTALQQRGVTLPSVSQIAADRRDPFRVLISTVISLRTKDSVTITASRRLFSEADTPAEVAALPPERVAELIYPAGFYRRKARNIHEIAKILLQRYGGSVPSDRDHLLSLPGVGVKTANLTLNLGFGIDAICVDTHVHRISNRCGWISTKTPEESEKALEQVMPRKYWIPLNELLVTYGQQICTPVSPRCSECPIRDICPRHGVTRSR